MRSKTLLLMAIMGMAAAALFAGGGAEAPGAGQMITLTMFAGEHPNSPLKGDLPVYQEIAKKTGVSIEFQAVLNGAQETEKLNVILASGDYPDMIKTSINNINEYARSEERRVGKECSC